MKEIRQENLMQLVERTQEWELKYHLWPYNMKEIRQEMQLLERTQEWNQNMTFGPIKDGTLGLASPKTIGV